MRVRMHILSVLFAIFLMEGVSVALAGPVPDTAPAASATATPETVRFDIIRFQVEGNHLLPAGVLESLLAPYTGKSRDFGDVQHALEALEAVYHERGYSAVQVYLPEQELVGGTVRLAVIEAHVRKVQVQDNHHFSTTNIRASLPGLREGEVPNLGAISESLRVANENPSKKITLEMQATDTDNAVDARIKVQDEKPWRVGLNVDNTGTPQSGRSHYSVTFQDANVADLDHVLSLQYTTSSDGPGVSIYGAGYHIPLYRLGDSIDLYGGYSDVASGSINGTPITGRGSVFGGRYNQGLKRIGDYTQRVTYGIDYKDYQGIPLASGLSAAYPATVLPLSVGYTGTWTLPTTTAVFSMGFFQNVPAGAHGSDADLQQSIHLTRPTASVSADYSGVRYSGNLTYALPASWLLRVAFTGQYTSDALIPGEQIGLTGANAVRGFPERSASTDRGIFGNLEVYTPDLCAGRWGGVSSCRLLAFADHGEGYSVGLGDASVGSVGLGLRLMVGKNLNATIDGAQVVDATGSAVGSPHKEGARYLHFQLGASF